jgi:hypothetical protein
MNSKYPQPAPSSFDPNDWMKQYKDLHKGELYPAFSNWTNQLTLPDVPDGTSATKECKDLVLLKPQREQFRADIEAQARSANAAIWPVWKAFGGDPMLPYKPASIALRAELMACLVVPIFQLKVDVNRARPATHCGLKIEPMFPTGHPYHPGHPSYPSGHATQAYAMALVLASIKPVLSDDLMLAARQVARNREIAGLHFPSDSAAGLALATHLVGLLLPNSEFQGLAQAAAAEW